MKAFDKLALGAVAAIVITNPASGQVILDGLDVVFQTIFQFGSTVNFAATGVVISYICYRMWLGRDVTTVPAKGAKTSKAGEFITT